MGTFTYVKQKKTSFPFLHSFLLVFFLDFPELVPFHLVFLNFPDLSNQKIFSESQNMTGSPPEPHNSLGIFCCCCARTVKIQREIKREVYMLQESGTGHFKTKGPRKRP
jgi:hypothetical protein